MFEKFRQMPSRFHRDERGQAMVVTAILAVVLFRSVAMSFNVGVAVAERIRTQVVADMAAYSGAVWQARFLNYCAYTRRAIISNYANIALMSAVSAHKRVLDDINDAGNIIMGMLGDSQAVTDMLEIMQTLRDQLVPGADNDFGNVIPNFVDGRMVAEYMANILAQAPDTLFWTISPIESIQWRVVNDCNFTTGDPELILANTDHATVGFSLPFDLPLSFLWNSGILNSASIGFPDSFPLGGNGILERRRIPLNEIETLFDEGMTKVSLFPLHWGGLIISGRPWTSFTVPGVAPEFSSPPMINFELPFILFVRTMEQFFQEMLPSPFPTTEITDRRVFSSEAFPIHDESFGIPLLVGSYVLFWLQGWAWNPWTGWTPWIISPMLPILLYDPFQLGEASDDDYQFRRQLDDVLVYEMRQNVQPRNAEPDVYAMVARVFETTDYYRMTPDRNLGLLDDDVFAGRTGNNNKDILCLARAKVIFSPPDEALPGRAGRAPNLNFPYWGARLARLNDGGGWTLMAIGTGGIPTIPRLFTIITGGSARY